MVTGTDSEKKWDALGTRDFEDSLCVCVKLANIKEKCTAEFWFLMVCDLRNFKIPAVPSRPWEWHGREFSADQKNARFYAELNLLFLKFLHNPKGEQRTVKLSFIFWKMDSLSQCIQMLTDLKSKVPFYWKLCLCISLSCVQLSGMLSSSPSNDWLHIDLRGWRLTGEEPVQIL